MTGVAIDIVGKFSIFFCFNKILTMVNFGFSGQFESKSQKCSDSRRIGANAACGLFVNFWSFDVTLSLSKGLSQAALGGTVNSHTASGVGMTKCHPEPVEGSRQCNKAEMLRQAQHDRFYRPGCFDCTSFRST